MTLHLPTLMLCATLVAGLAAVVLSATMRSSSAFRGHTWWVGALWAVCGGLALHMPGTPPAALDLLSHVLLLLWPLALLVGLRGFDARVRMAQPMRTDAVLAALAALAVVAGELAGAGTPAPMLTFTLAASALHGYAAALAISADGAGEPDSLQRFGALHAVTSLALLTRGLAVADVPGLDAVHAHALVLAISAAGFAHLAVHAMFARSARELRESRRRLRVLANTDMLTRVPNRRRFHELARRAADCAPPGSSAVVMFDIDHFKQVNDVLGHAAGDRALRLVSRCMQEVLRQQDVAGRYGGDEFALLLPATRTEDAIAAAARIVARVQAGVRSRSTGVPRLSLSFGVVQMLADESVDEALRRADQALYEAKRQGRGRAVVAEGDEVQPVFTESQRLGLTPH